MAWKNQYQLIEEYKDDDFRKKFVKFYGLSEFLRQCIVSADYLPSDKYAEAIVLTDFGNAFLSQMLDSEKNFSESIIKIALFVSFYHQDIFIDVESSSYDSLLSVLHSEIIERKIRFPWVYDNQLYDRFFDLFPSQTKKLSYAETEQLMHNTLYGVFQLDNVIVGPLGALTSYGCRYLKPTRAVPLWHCSDPSCNALHTTNLSTGNHLISVLTRTIDLINSKLYGQSSEWSGFYRQCVRPTNHYDDHHLGTFPWLLANAFSEQELRSVLQRLLASESKRIRKKIPDSRNVQQIFRNPPEKIVSQLSKAECFQIILLMPDEIIIEALETQIEEQKIKIPATEIRAAKFFNASGGWFRIVWQCSNLGVRAVSKNKRIGLTRLKRLINQLYGSNKDNEQLDWILRHTDEESFNKRLEKYLHEQNPTEIVKELFLSSQNHLETTFELLRYGKFELPASSADETQLVNKILWKLGFDVGSYPLYQERFWIRLTRLAEASRIYSEYSEADKENIRSAGANFFVSLEEILDYSLSFITWVLLSDHYGETKFICNLDAARHFMATEMHGKSISSSGSLEPLRFNGEGVNTLFPLIQGFKLLAIVCKEILEGSQDDNLRANSMFPRYHNKTEIQLFPFSHKMCLLDINSDDRKIILEKLIEITNNLDAANVAGVRNRMQHKRKAHEFPSQDEIETVCTAVIKTVSIMEISGICPLTYLYEGEMTDSYKRTKINLRDYKGRIVTLSSPSQYSAAVHVSLNDPLIVVPWLHLGESSECLRFRIMEESDYTKLWSEYPKKRLRLPSSEGLKKNVLDTETS